MPNLPCLVVIDLAEGETLSFQFVTWLHAIAWSEDNLTLWVSFPYHKLPLCQVWWPSTLWKRKYFVFNFSRDLMRPNCHRVMWHYGRVPFIISLHLIAKFGGHRRCARKEILFFVYHVTSRDFVVRESCDTMGEFPWSSVTTLQSLLIIELLEEEMLSSHFVTWLHVTRGQRVMWHNGWVILIISHRLVKIGGHRLCGIGDIKLLICHVTPRDHVARGSCDIMGEFSSS